MRIICLRLARQMTEDGYAAEDVAQEAMLRAWRYRHQLREGDRQERWLAQIVRREAARRHQKQRPRPVNEMEGAGAEDPRLIDAGERLDIQQALERLDRSDRMLLRLRYEQDLTQPAIANLLGLPEGTVKVRLHRARAKLHQAIKDE